MDCIRFMIALNFVVILCVVTWMIVDIVNDTREINELDEEIMELEKKLAQRRVTERTPRASQDIITMDILNRLHVLEEKVSMMHKEK